MKKCVTAAAVLSMTVVLTGCGDVLSSEFHGRWQCNSDVMEIGGRSISYKVSSSNKDFFSKGTSWNSNWASTIEKAWPDLNGYTGVMLEGQGPVHVRLKREGSVLLLDGRRCFRL